VSVTGNSFSRAYPNYAWACKASQRADKSGRNQQRLHGHAAKSFIPYTWNNLSLYVVGLSATGPAVEKEEHMGHLDTKRRVFGYVAEI